MLFCSFPPSPLQRKMSYSSSSWVLECALFTLVARKHLLIHSTSNEALSLTPFPPEQFRFACQTHPSLPPQTFFCLTPQKEKDFNGVIVRRMREGKKQGEPLFSLPPLPSVRTGLVRGKRVRLRNCCFFFFPSLSSPPG